MVRVFCSCERVKYDIVSNRFKERMIVRTIVIHDFRTTFGKKGITLVTFNYFARETIRERAAQSKERVARLRGRVAQLRENRDKRS